ncbi:spore germination protein [Alkalihalobacillus sp. MEB130]|uniref:GerAB/ArcD/ProY family transporter n=1 Tax=Alkalihalobacillus sp. MEB130 TaxID=2976704 RepID=UPI0028DF153F|nr:GerAB/ArcD/ProY family transporter [Alkalihalobacillus sp. MEB130]MDT8860872.1 spore germination protein [Alkalihalobacillus sp. MEB130]
MVKSDHYRITPLEMSVTVVSMLLAVGVLTLPRTLAEILETGDGWIAVLASAGIVMGLVYLIVQLQKQYPNQTLFEYIGEKGLGRYISKILSLLFILYFIPFLAYEARMLTIIVRMYLLDRTPPELTLAIILLTSVYAVSKGIQGIVHLNLMFLPFIVFIYFVLIIFNVENMSINELLPVLPKGIPSLVQALEPTIFSFLGIELLFFWMAYIKTSKLSAWPINLGIFFVSMLYFFIVTTSYLVLSVTGVKNTVFPTVALAKEVEIIEGLIERFEPVMIVIWIMAIFNTMAIIHLLAVQTIKKEFAKRKVQAFIPAIVTFFSYMIAFIPNSIEEVFVLGNIVSYAGFALILLSLVIGYGTVWLRKRGKKNRQKTGEIAK